MIPIRVAGSCTTKQTSQAQQTQPSLICRCMLNAISAMLWNEYTVEIFIDVSMAPTTTLSPSPSTHRSASSACKKNVELGYKSNNMQRSMTSWSGRCSGEHLALGRIAAPSCSHSGQAHFGAKQTSVYKQVSRCERRTTRRDLKNIPQPISYSVLQCMQRPLRH
jgi:hypothetical protein